MTLAMHAPLGWSETAHAPISYPSQSLDAALKELAARTQLQIIYLSDLTDGCTAPEVPADRSVADTLASMLAGSGLTFRFLNQRTVVLERAASNVGSPKTRTTAFETHRSRRPIRLAQATIEAPVAASSSDHPQVEFGEEVVVTGTRVADRTRLDTLAPVDVL